MTTIDALTVVAAVGSSWAMTGLIWTVQVVHYPLFDAVERDDRAWSAFEHRHRLRMSLVVGPIMAVQIIAGTALVLDPPPGIDRTLPLIALGILVVPYATTAFVSVPLHDRLADTFDATAHRRLVGTNWLRTVTWTAHAVIVAAIAVAALTVDTVAERT